MSESRIDARLINGEVYLSKTDFLAYLSSIGDVPNLNENQRQLIAAMIQDIQEGWIKPDPMGDVDRAEVCQPLEENTKQQG